MRVHDALDTEGRALRLVNVPTTARRVLEILSLTDTFGVDDAPDTNEGEGSDERRLL